MNIQKVLRFLEKYLNQKDVETRMKIKDKCNTLMEIIEKEPKSIAWKIRAVVGERKRWYQIPEI